MLYRKQMCFLLLCFAEIRLDKGGSEGLVAMEGRGIGRIGMADIEDNESGGPRARRDAVPRVVRVTVATVPGSSRCLADCVESWIA